MLRVGNGLAPASPNGFAFESSWRSLLAPSALSSIELACVSIENKEVRRDLRRAARFLSDGELRSAIRETDRVWRRFPHHSRMLAPAYGRLLTLEGRQLNAALRLLRHARDPDPDGTALCSLLLLQLRKSEEARRCIDDALARYCVVPDSLLAAAARRIAMASDGKLSGWAGLGPALDLVGEMVRIDARELLEIELDTNVLDERPLRTECVEAAFGFSHSLLLPRPGALIQVRCRTAPLLGAKLKVPRSFGLDGRALSTDRVIHGWAGFGWCPTEPFALRVEDEHGVRREEPSDELSGRGFRHAFRCDLDRAGVRGNRILISAQLPDGRWTPLPDAPLLLEPAVRKKNGFKALPAWTTQASADPPQRHAVPSTVMVDVVIPVYSGLRETLACIESVRATLTAHERIVVVNDATPDLELAAALEDLANARAIVLLRNHTNLGFVGSVNRGLDLHPTHDAVLLNSDTVVFGNWLSRLRAAAYALPHIGTVTPFSNSGTIASYPNDGRNDVDVQGAAQLDQLAAATHSGVSVDIPVGVGFCLYVRRECLDEVGQFDALAFGKGYGEETDFCLRARQQGYSHRLAADVFVYQTGGLSFGRRRAALHDRSQRLINLRHPGYDPFIASFIDQDPLRRLRRALDEKRLRKLDGSFVLLLTHDRGGEVVRYSDERQRAIAQSGLIPIVLRPVKRAGRQAFQLSTEAAQAPSLEYELPQDGDALRKILGSLRIEFVEIQHFIDLGQPIVDLVRALGIPYDIYIHDYIWFCPRITLMDSAGRYCGEPDLAACVRCVKTNGSLLGEAISVGELRTRSAAWLADARHVIAPSLDSALRMQRRFAGLAIDIRPHGEFAEQRPAQWPLFSRPVTRIALIGQIFEHKGYAILLACAQDAKARELPLEFIVIGSSQDDAALEATGKVFITGGYNEGEAAPLIQREEPDLAFFPAAWPETWSYTLDEALQAGLPIAAFDLGVIADRVRGTEYEMLFPFDLPARDINDEFMRRATKQLCAAPLEKATNDEEHKHGAMIEKAASIATLPQESLAASVHFLPLHAGLYSFSIGSGAQTSVIAEGNPAALQVPAIHVGFGPGVRAGQIEFMSAPDASGSWLYTKDDALITRINGSGATLMLTSVKSLTGEVLSVKIQRLDSRADNDVASRPAVAKSTAEDSAQHPATRPS